MIYYGLATNRKEDKNLRFDLTSNQRYSAYQEALDFCEENDVVFQEIRFVKGTSKQGSTNTKFFKDRKRNNGKNGKGYDKAL